MSLISTNLKNSFYVYVIFQRIRNIRTWFESKLNETCLKAHAYKLRSVKSKLYFLKPVLATVVIAKLHK